MRSPPVVVVGDSVFRMVTLGSKTSSLSSPEASTGNVDSESSFPLAVQELDR
jgi:hypothetical protein